MKSASVKLAFMSLILSGFFMTACSVERIDFEDFIEGEIVSEVFGDRGAGPVKVKGKNPKFPVDTNAAVIFDSSCAPGGIPADCSGSDADLGSPNIDFDGPGVGDGGAAGSPFENASEQGNVLIIAENLDDEDDDDLVDDPDDADEEEAQFCFDFSELGSVTILKITIIDVEEDELAAEVELYDGGMDLLAAFILPQTGDNGVASVSLGPTKGVVEMVVTVNGSAAIDNIVFMPDKDSDSDIVTSFTEKRVPINDLPISGN